MILSRIFENNLKLNKYIIFLKIFDYCFIYKNFLIDIQ